MMSLYKNCIKISIKYILPIFLIFSACSSLQRDSNQNGNLLSNHKAFSKDSSYYVNIPFGWFSSFDNSEYSSDIFLSKKDFNAVINIIPMYIDSNYAIDYKLVDLSRIMKKAAQNSDLILIGEVEFFTINKIKCAAYKYYNNFSLPVRTIIFKFNNRYYELNAYITEEGLNGKLIPNILYSVQNAILYSIKKHY